TRGAGAPASSRYTIRRVPRDSSQPLSTSNCRGSPFLRANSSRLRRLEPPLLGELPCVNSPRRAKASGNLSPDDFIANDIASPWPQPAKQIHCPVRALRENDGRESSWNGQHPYR